MNKGKKTNKSKHYEKLMAGFLVITLLGLLILLVSMYRHDKANALVYARETTDFLKDSCDRYDNTILDNSSTASEMVRETAETLASCATSTQLTDTGYLTNYASSQKMSGILILDENMNLVTQVNIGEEDGYQLWKDLISHTSKNSIARYPQKSYISQVRENNCNYVIAMVSRSDAKGVIICYENIERVSTDHYAYSFTSLLKNNTFHKNPTIVITDGNDILASNVNGLNSLVTFQDQNSENEQRTWDSRSLIRLNMGYHSWYGTRTVYGKYHIFVFYPDGELFSNIPLTLAFAIAAFALIILFIVLIRQHFSRLDLKKEEAYLQKMRAIGSLYSSILLLHLDTCEFEPLKLSDQLSALIDGKKDAYEIYDLIYGKLVAPQSKKGFQEFLSPENLINHIAKEPSLGMIFQAVNDIWYSCYLIPESFAADGSVQTVLIISRDINDYKTKEEVFQNELRKAARDADMANAVKTTFLRRMSHDVRTPINGIQGMAEIARKNLDNPDTIAECLDKITTSSAYLLELVNDVLRMSKLESGNIVLEEKPFYFQNVLMETASFIEVQAQQKGVNFSVACRHDSGMLLLGSPLHVRQILQNIMSNAIKYTPAGGSVTVTSQETILGKESATYEIFCTDTGIGMSKDFQAHAFEPFVQEDDSSARSSLTGVGLGLSIVKDLVDRMHGKIHFSSEQGKGTTFVITLTFKLDPSNPELPNSTRDTLTSDASDDEVSMPLEGIRVLVAEDNELNMEIAKYLLAEKGAHISEAHNGQEALDLFQLAKPGTYQVILMDIMMPVMNGLEAARQIRALRRADAKEIPIFAMTANAFVEDIQQSVAAGMNEHLTKPLDVDQLVEKILNYK